MGRNAMKDGHYLLLAVAVGVVAALAKFTYTFFPGSNAIDVVAFLTTSAVLVYGRPRHSWRWVVGLIAPVMILVLVVLGLNGPAHLRQGVGIGWAYSAIIIPVAALCGGRLAYLLARRNARHQKRPA